MANGRPRPDPDMQGRCDPRFAAVRDAFAANFAERGETGAAACLVVHGTVVADLWGGRAGPGPRVWRRDTLVNVFSVGKGLIAACAARLAAQRRLYPDARVARYWPEFAAAGKAGITVRQLLSHQAGLPARHDRLPDASMLDWAFMAIRAVVSELGRSVLEPLLATDGGYRGPRVRCGAGHQARFVSYRAKTIDTVLGPVALRRARYRCAACGDGLAPRLGRSLEALAKVAEDVRGQLMLAAMRRFPARRMDEPTPSEVKQLNEQPVSLTLMQHLVARAAERGVPANQRLLRFRNGQPYGYRRDPGTNSVTSAYAVPNRARNAVFHSIDDVGQRRPRPLHSAAVHGRPPAIPFGRGFAVAPASRSQPRLRGAGGL